MADPIHVSLQSETDETSVRVYDNEGSVDTDDVTFQFRVPARSASSDASDGPSEAKPDPDAIAPLAAVPSDGTLRCEALRDDRGTEFILHRKGDAVVAWKNFCPHRPNVPLDPGTGAIVSGDQLVCHKHGARFEQDEGVCTAGPCAGDALDSIAVEIRDSTVYLADDRYDNARQI